MGVNNNAIVFVGYHVDELTDTEKERLKRKGIDLDSEEFEEDPMGYTREVDIHDFMYDGVWLIGKEIADSGAYASVEFVTEDFTRRVFDAFNFCCGLFESVPKVYVFNHQQ